MTEAKKRAKRSKARLLLVVALIVALTVVLGSWTTVFVAGLLRWGKETDTRGQFGDSFGIIGGLFAGLAFIAASLGAYFQWVALRDEREGSAAEAVEARFFQLLISLQTTLNEMKQGENEGRQATRKIADWLLRDLKSCRNVTAAISDSDRHAEIQAWFELFYEGKDCKGAINATVAPASDLLGHVFRLIYHILKYVNASTVIEPEDKAAYAALLRAHLSNPELAMLFYNAMTRHGFQKAFPLLAGYRMFENMKRSTLLDPVGDWQFYHKLIDQRRKDIEALVGEVPATQSDEEVAGYPDTAPKLVGKV